MATQLLENLVIIDPNLHKGRPVVAGTGVAVRTIVGHYKLGLSAEEIADDMNISLAGVYAALAYYHANTDELEADITSNSEATVIADFVHG